jgi:hypothetical protein
VERSIEATGNGLVKVLQIAGRGGDKLTDRNNNVWVLVIVMAFLDIQRKKLALKFVCLQVGELVE